MPGTNLPDPSIVVRLEGQQAATGRDTLSGEVERRGGSGPLQERHHQADVARTDEPPARRSRQGAMHDLARHCSRQGAERLEGRRDPAVLVAHALAPRPPGLGVDHACRGRQIGGRVGEDVDHGLLILTLQHWKKFVADAIAGDGHVQIGRILAPGLSSAFEIGTEIGTPDLQQRPDDVIAAGADGAEPPSRAPRSSRSSSVSATIVARVRGGDDRAGEPGARAFVSVVADAMGRRFNRRP